MVDPITSALSIMANAAGVHSWFTGIHSGQDQRRLLEEVSRMRFAVERLTDHILYVPSLKEVKDLTASRREQLEERRVIAELLAPVQNVLREEIMASAVVATPERLRAAFAKDPWEVLFSIRPIGKVKRPPDPDLIPVVFGEHGLYYLGWQMKGALPGLLDCDYKPAVPVLTLGVGRKSAKPEEKPEEKNAVLAGVAESGTNVGVNETLLPENYIKLLSFFSKLTGIISLVAFLSGFSGFSVLFAVTAIFLGGVAYAVNRGRSKRFRASSQLETNDNDV